MNPITSFQSPALRGVRGWLLALCAVMTVVGPVISAWLMAGEYAAAAPDFAGSRRVLVVFFSTLVLTSAAVAYGMHAGLLLWRVRPGAVAAAKNALLFGLAVDVVSAAMRTAMAPVAVAESGWALRGDLLSTLLPGLVFFTVCFAYLNRSARVQATYNA